MRNQFWYPLLKGANHIISVWLLSSLHLKMFVHKAVVFCVMDLLSSTSQVSQFYVKASVKTLAGVKIKEL